MPQNSAHSAAIDARRDRPAIAAPLTWPGIASILPASRGTQKLWMTSLLVTAESHRLPGRDMQDVDRAMRRAIGLADSGRSSPIAAPSTSILRAGAFAGCGSSRSPVHQRIDHQRRQHHGRQARSPPPTSHTRGGTLAPDARPQERKRQQHHHQREQQRPRRPASPTTGRRSTPPRVRPDRASTTVRVQPAADRGVRHATIGRVNQQRRRVIGDGIAPESRR